MKICYVSEMNFTAKINTYKSNMSVLFVEMWMLEATHYHLNTIHDDPSILDQYDACVFIYPKSQPFALTIVDTIKKHTKLIIHQEGPRDFWYDWKPVEQQYMLHAFDVCDVFLVNNPCDLSFFSGYMGDKVMYAPVSFHPKSIELNRMESPINKNRILIGGNMCKWYGGLSSYQVVKDSGFDITIPSMGRKQDQEETLVNDEVGYLPFVEFDNWVRVLSNHTYVVHLMDAIGGGNVCLTASALGIPCIGNELWDTQIKCQPKLAVPVWDLIRAKELFQKLCTDKEFYDGCSKTAKENAYKYYSCEVLKPYYQAEIKKRLRL